MLTLRWRHQIKKVVVAASVNEPIASWGKETSSQSRDWYENLNVGDYSFFGGGRESMVLMPHNYGSTSMKRSKLTMISFSATS